MSHTEKRIAEQPNPTPLKKAERKVERESGGVWVCVRERDRERGERVRRERAYFFFLPLEEREREGSSGVPGPRGRQAVSPPPLSFRYQLVNSSYNPATIIPTPLLFFFLSYASPPIHLGKRTKKKVLGVSVSGMVSNPRVVLFSFRFRLFFCASRIQFLRPLIGLVSICSCRWRLF